MGESEGSLLPILRRCHVPRQQRRPAAVVAVAPARAVGAERLPAAMLDLDARRRRAARRQTGSRPRWRPRGRGGGATGSRNGPAAPRPSPRPSHARCRPAVRSKIRPPGRGSRTTVRSGSAADGVIGRPPAVDVGGPDLERAVGRAGDLEGEPDRLDHGARRSARAVFSATRRKRAAASPQTRSR